MLKRRLTEAGANELVKSDAGALLIQFRADKGTLEYEEFVAERTTVPTPDKFEDQFKLLMQLAALNEELYVWGSGAKIHQHG